MINMSKFARIVYGSIFFIVGFIGIFASVYYFIEIKKSTDLSEKNQNIVNEIKLCKDEARKVSVSFSATVKGNTIELKKYGTKNWSQDIAASSMIIEKCDNLELEKYCFGECKVNGGTNFTGSILILKKNNAEQP